MKRNIYKILLKMSANYNLVYFLLCFYMYNIYVLLLKVKEKAGGE